MKDRKKQTEFIKKRPYLIWWVKNYERLNDEAIVEATLNYGDWDDVQKLIEIIGIQETAQIFRKLARRRRCNFDLHTKNLFSHYFKKHAQRNIR